VSVVFILPHPSTFVRRHIALVVAVVVVVIAISLVHLNLSVSLFTMSLLSAGQSFGGVQKVKNKDSWDVFVKIHYLDEEKGYICGTYVSNSLLFDATILALKTPTIHVANTTN
jgi:hypothetical protein